METENTGVIVEARMETYTPVIMSRQKPTYSYRISIIVLSGIVSHEVWHLPPTESTFFLYLIRLFFSEKILCDLRALPLKSFRGDGFFYEGAD